MKLGLVSSRFDVTYIEHGREVREENVSRSRATLLSSMGVLLESRPVDLVIVPDALTGEELAASTALVREICRDVEKLSLSAIEHARLVRKCVSIHRAVCAP